MMLMVIIHIIGPFDFGKKTSLLITMIIDSLVWRQIEAVLWSMYILLWVKYYLIRIDGIVLQNVLYEIHITMSLHLRG